MYGTVLDSIEQLTGAAGGTLVWFDEFAGVNTGGGSLGDAMASYSPDLFPEDPMQHWALSMPGSTFISDGSEHPQGRSFDFTAHTRTRPYADFYRPLDIAFIMGVWPSGLAYGSPQMFGLLLTKPHPFEPFAPDVVAKLRHLEIPFRLAARRIAQFRSLEQRADVLARLPERQSGSFALWDPEGRLVWVSLKAQRHLESRVRRADLERAAKVARGQLRSALAERETLLGRPRLLRAPDGPAMLVTFSWLPSGDRRRWLLAEIRDHSEDASPLKRLTPAELRLLRLLTRGLSNAELSQQLGISGETVKTHLKRIFLKLNVNSRGKAIRIASKIFTD
jgi:DNA-binding CsgD family transcriptional regulator